MKSLVGPQCVGWFGQAIWKGSTVVVAAPVHLHEAPRSISNHIKVVAGVVW